MDLGISDRSALICGGSRGLGYACAKALAREGVRVTLAARDGAALEDAASRLYQEIGHRPAIVRADLSTSEGRTVALARLPDPDILVTNAGGPPSKDFRELTAADWASALDTNFLSAVELIRATVDPMIARGFGRIVNITSVTVRMPVERLDLSTAPRMALTGYVAGVARQVARHNVTINNLLPGTVLTERLQALGEVADKLIAKVPAGRAGTPEEFGALCAFLCGAQAGFVTGQNIMVDGGLAPVTV
jgi:3-oxoacyl-[acyl-carrier protein] reductase